MYDREGDEKDDGIGLFYYDKDNYFDKDVFEISRKYRQNQDKYIGMILLFPNIL